MINQHSKPGEDLGDPDRIGTQHTSCSSSHTCGVTHVKISWTLVHGTETEHNGGNHL